MLDKKNGIFLEKGETINLSKQCLPKGSNTEVCWSSSNETVATVDEAGKVTGIKNGRAIITCVTTEWPEVKATCNVLVGGFPNISLKDYDGAIYNVGDEFVIEAKPEVEYIFKDLVWNVSDQKIVKIVNSDRNFITLRAIAPGTIKLSAKTSDAAFSDDAIINIRQLAQSIAFSSDNYTLYTGEPKQLEVIFTPSNTTSRKLKYESADQDIADVYYYDDNEIQGVSEGNTIITASTTDGTNLKAYCNVTVLQSIVAIILDKYAIELTKGDTQSLSFQTIPSNAKQNTFWMSTNEAVATVSQTGKVTSTGNGLAEVILTTTEGPKRHASCVVYVPTVPTGIKNTETGKIEISAKNKQITVRGLAENDVIHLYAPNGILLYSGTNENIKVPASGVYFVKVNSKVHKVAVN